MKQYRKVVRKIILLLFSIPVILIYLLTNPVASLCQFIHPSGIVHNPSALDPTTPHFAELPGHFLSQLVCIYSAAHLCRFFA